MSAFENEATDVMIYLLMLCNGVGIDLLKATHAKINRNTKRFPVSPLFAVTKSQNNTELLAKSALATLRRSRVLSADLIIQRAANGLAISIRSCVNFRLNNVGG